ncbi:type VI secretion system tube protein Hcp [bacterium]|nr:type VI secretion system tube protein Hcp [bacterium]
MPTRLIVLFTLAVFLLPNSTFALFGKTKEKEEAKPNWTVEIVGIHAYAKDVRNLPKKTEILSISTGINCYDKNVEFGDISLVTYYNVLTPYLFQAVSEKKLFPKVIINLEKGGVLINYELSEAMITSVRPGGSAQSSEPLLLQEVSFSFKKIKLSYKNSKTESEVELVNKQKKAE